MALTKDGLIERLEEIRFVLECKVGELHTEAQVLTGTVGDYAEEKLQDAMDELDEFVEAAEMQYGLLELWVKSNKVLIVIGAGLFGLGMIVGQALSYI